MNKELATISLAIILAEGCVVTLAMEKAPIPPHTKIVAPDPALPTEVKALAGRWSGEWGLNRPGFSGGLRV